MNESYLIADLDSRQTGAIAGKARARRVDQVISLSPVGLGLAMQRTAAVTRTGEALTHPRRRSAGW